MQLKRYKKNNGSENRETSKTIRIERKIEFSRKLNFKRTPRYGIKEAVQRYELKGVIEHSGNTTKEGHYTAYVREGESWMQWDDETSAAIPWREVKDKQAYILIWERCEDEDEEHRANNDQKFEIMRRECMQGVGNEENGNVRKVAVSKIETQENNEMEIDAHGKKEEAKNKQIY